MNLCGARAQNAKSLQEQRLVQTCVKCGVRRSLDLRSQHFVRCCAFMPPARKIEVLNVENSHFRGNFA